VFDPGECVTVKGVSVYHWKRWDPAKFIDADDFFAAGKLPALTAPTARGENEGAEVETKARRLYGFEEGLADMSAAKVYDGILRRGEALAGTVQVKLAKRDKKTGLAKLTATLAPVDEAKTTVGGSFDPNGQSFVATAKDGRTLELTLGADGFCGAFDGCEIDGARNRFSSKAADDKAAVAVADGWVGAYAIAAPAEGGWDTYAVTIAKKGKAKVAGTLADGTKVSATAQMIVGAEDCCIPVVCAKKGVSPAFCIWLGADGASVDGIDGAVVGKVGGLSGASALTFDAEALAALVAGGTAEVQTAYLPTGATVVPKGTKWTLAPDEAGAVRKSGLKLSYSAKAGSFKGSFKAFAVVKGKAKATTVSLTGVVVDGVGYGTATVKGKGSVAIKVE